MKTNYTHIGILLDASSSMYSIQTDIIGGYNKLIDEQKLEKGDLTVSIAQFAGPGTFKVISDMKKISEVEALTTSNYVPNGNTALMDAATKFITDIGNKLSSLSEAEKPEKVLITLITDGAENASIESTKASLANLIKHQEEKYNWQFAFIGANQDSFAESSKIGITRNSVNYSADVLGVNKMFKGMSSKMSSYRGGDITFELSQEDIDKA